MYSKELRFRTKKRFDFLLLDRKVERFVKEAGIEQGLVFLFCPHTTAALVCNENDPGVHRDFEKVFDRLVPPEMDYEHTGEGEANARAHQLAMILGNEMVVPVREGGVDLGTWQSLFFVELLEPRQRRVVLLLFEG